MKAFNKNYRERISFTVFVMCVLMMFIYKRLFKIALCILLSSEIHYYKQF